MDDKEIWKPVVGFEGFYEVSNKGRVRGVEHYVPTFNKGTLYQQIVYGKILKPSQKSDGYLAVDLHKNAVRKTITVHRLVATAFIPNPDNKPCVNHLDEVKTHNWVENLEWCTVYENLHYGTGPERRSLTLKQHWANGEIHRRPNHKIKKVAKYSKGGELLTVYQSFTEAVKALGIKGCDAHVCQCLNGQRQTAYGYRWEYLDG